MLNRHTCKIRKRKQSMHVKQLDYDQMQQQLHAFHNQLVEDIKRPNIQYIVDTFSMHMNRTVFDLYTIAVSIKSRKYRFVVDSGAQISGIFSNCYGVLNGSKEVTSTLVKSAGGQVQEMQRIQLDSYFVGGLKINNHTIALLNEKDFKIPLLPPIDLEFDGILGWDVLQQLDFELNDKTKRFSVLKEVEIIHTKNLLQTKLPVVIVEDAKQQYAMFGIDTGASVSWFDELYSTQQKLKKTKTKHFLQVGVFGLERKQAQLVKASGFILLEHLIQMKNTRHAQTEFITGKHVDGMFGNEIFRKRAIQFLTSKDIVKIVE